MPNITLPDGKQLSFSESVTGFQLAEKISKSLSKQALIISVDGPVSYTHLTLPTIYSV